MPKNWAITIQLHRTNNTTTLQRSKKRIKFNESYNLGDFIDTNPSTNRAKYVDNIDNSFLGDWLSKMGGFMMGAILGLIGGSFAYVHSKEKIPI